MSNRPALRFLVPATIVAVVIRSAALAPAAADWITVRANDKAYRNNRRKEVVLLGQLGWAAGSKAGKPTFSDFCLSGLAPTGRERAALGILSAACRRTACQPGST